VLHWFSHWGGGLRFYSIPVSSLQSFGDDRGAFNDQQIARKPRLVSRIALSYQCNRIGRGASQGLNDVMDCPSGK
jgi:hypothetical protein